MMARNTKFTEFNFQKNKLVIIGLSAAACLDSFAAEYTNKIGITMIDIAAGSFTMGACKEITSKEANNKASRASTPIKANCSNPSREAHDNETPPRQVNIAKFQLAKTEVTLGQYKLFINATGRKDLMTAEFLKENKYGDNASVVMVSWDDAKDFVAWLSKTDGGGYRLPSEAEWEYACKANVAAAYCGSEKIDAVAWVSINSNKRINKPAEKQSNAFGLFDMSGNVSEWVEDYYHDTYQGAPSTGSAWTKGGDQNFRVNRGGSWFSFSSYARTTARNNDLPENKTNFTGLRIARTR